jgi:cell division protein FtsB
MKSVLLGMMLVLGTLQYKLWVASDGVRGVTAVQNQISTQQKNNEALSEDNAVLLQHINALKMGGTAVEARARDELGMVKGGESFYQTIG